MAYDKSLALKTNFLLIFDKSPDVQYFCQEVPIPAMSIDTIDIDMGRTFYAEVGGNITFDSLDITFLVDENLKNYKDIYDWFMKLRNPQAGTFGKHTTTSTDKSDAAITILDNNKNEQVKFTFVDCFPTSLSGLIYDVKEQGDEPQIATLTLDYTYYTMETLT